MSGLYHNRDQAEMAAEKLRIFAQPQRLMILSYLLAQREQPVSAIDEATGIGQPALSQQLAELRKSGLVSMRRQARQVYYNLADEATRATVGAMEVLFGQPGKGNMIKPPVPASENIEPAPRPAPKGNTGAAFFARILTN